MKENKSGRKNLIYIIIGLVIFALLFIFVYRQFKSESEKRSVYIETNNEGKEDYIEINATMMSIDPVKGEMTVRLDYDTKGGLSNAAGLPKEDYMLYVNNASGKQEHNFRKNRIMNPVEISLNLFDGQVTEYPFDNHKAEFIIYTGKTKNTISNETMQSGMEYDSLVPVENILHFTGNITGYQIDAELDPGNNGAFSVLNIHIGRASSVIFFAGFVMIVMWVLIIMLILLIYSVVIHRRKIEITMFTFASAMLFAFPAFRNMMPFAPPVGALPDFIAFFWAEAAAALTLVILISAWIIRRQN
jgi:hypothetical protein